MTDAAEKFPAAVYKDTVLAPLFETMKRQHWRHLMRIHEAHAVMLAEQSLLEADEARAILAALAGLEAGLPAALPTLAYTGEREDFFFLIDAELQARIGRSTAGRLHTGRSRNDIDHTLFKMALRQRLLASGTLLAELIDTLLHLAARHRDTLVVAYTHGQPAQPTTWGHYLCALAEVLLRDLGRLLHAYDTVDLCPMGAAAITTTGFPIDRARVAALLGFQAMQLNAYGAIAACDYTTETYAAVKLMLLNIGRFVQDLNQWTGLEVAHLRVPDGFVQRSSIMPQKRNPVPVEHLRLICSLGAGRCDAVLLAMHNTPFTDMNDNEHETHEAGAEAFATADRALALLRGFVAAVEVDEANVRRHIDASCVTMTELADSLVRSEGISFGEAHETCSLLARHILQRSLTLTSVPYAAFAEAFASVLGRRPAIAEADFQRFGTPEHFIAVRDRPGGPAPAAMDHGIATCRGVLTDAEARIAAHRRRLQQAEAALGEAVGRFARGGRRRYDGR